MAQCHYLYLLLLFFNWTLSLSPQKDWKEIVALRYKGGKDAALWQFLNLSYITPVDNWFQVEMYTGLFF